MDMRSWKKVLLQWITECNLMDRNYFNIEQSDLDTFFRNFCRQHNKTKSGEIPNLTEFLQKYYSDFEPHLDDNNALSSADYIYVYSLLLHFSCVKHPETRFHEICQKLPEHYQQCIASFFKELLDVKTLNKEALRHAIAQVADTHISPPRLNDSFSSTCGGQALSNCARLESPMKTPQRSAGVQRISPSTPKSYLLEERTRELYNLRAELDTERYEKGLLEVQIKQNEDKILKLNQDHRKLQQQIQDLKNDILTKTNEDDTAGCEDGQQAQKRLIKELSHKEQELFRLRDVLRTLREEKSLVDEKLKYADKQIVLCMNRIKELDYKVDELTEELEKKNGTIKYLSDNKMELEQFIAETRSASTNSKVDLNTSIDCMDASFSRSGAPNSSGSISSPENLGCSVVDVQLREKEYENCQLREELASMRSTNKRLAHSIYRLTSHEAKEFEINIESGIRTESIDGDDRALDPIEQLNIFSNCLEKINSYHKDEKLKTKQLQEQVQLLEDRNMELARSLQAHTDEVCVLKESIDCIELRNDELTKAKEELEGDLRACGKNLEELEKHKQEVCLELEHTIGQRARFAEQVEELKAKLEQQTQTNDVLKKTNTQLSAESQELQDKLVAQEEEFSLRTNELQLEVKSLKERLQRRIEEVEAHEISEKTIKANYEQLLIENDLLKKEAREVDHHLEVMRSKLHDKEAEMAKLGEEIVELNSQNNTLEERLDALSRTYENEKANSNVLLASREERINKMGIECSQLQQELEQSKAALESAISDCRQQMEEEMLLNRHLDTIFSLLNVPLNDDKLSAKLNSLGKLVKELVEHSAEADGKLTSLEHDHRQCSTKIESLMKQLEEDSFFADQHKESAEEMKQLQEQYDDKIEKLKERQRHFIEKVKADLRAKEEELSQRMQEANEEFESSLERLRSELEIEKEHHSNKERELLLVIGEHNELKKRLNESESHIETLQKANVELQTRNKERISRLESQVAECTAENDQLQEEIRVFKTEMDLNIRRLLDADKALATLSEQVKAAEEAKLDLSAKLEFSEKCLQEAECKLELVREENGRNSAELQAVRQRHNDQITELKATIERQAETIGQLDENVKKLKAEKERLLKEASELTAQIQREQEEKTMLLSSLERSVDQLKAAVEEKDCRSTALEQRIADLQERIEATSAQNTKLQGELVSREAELRLALDEQRQERDEFQQKLSILTSKLTESSQKLEAYDMALIEILAILENNVNIAAEMGDCDVRNIFNADDTQTDCHLSHLRRVLNRVVHFDDQLHMQLSQMAQRRDEAANSMEVLAKANTELSSQLDRNQKELADLKEHLMSEKRMNDNRMSQEIKRLEDDLHNLENVNERLAGENGKMQSKLSALEQELDAARIQIDKLKEDNSLLREEVSTKDKTLAELVQKEKQLQEAIRKYQVCVETSAERCSSLQSQYEEQTTKLESTEKELRAAQDQFGQTQAQLQQLQEQYNALRNDHERQTERNRQQQTTCEAMESELAHKSKELLVLQAQNMEVSSERKELEEQLRNTTKQLDETVRAKLNAESKCQKLESDYQQLERDVGFVRAQLQSAHEEHGRLLKEVEMLKEDKQHLNEEIKVSRRDLQRANDNVTRLIQQIASIRLEKEAVLEENQLLRKQLEETGRSQSSSESKLKSFVERSQSLERKLLSAENELKSLRSQLEKSENNVEKLSGENKKLRDSQDTSTKRIEKLALKLGDSQARSTKLERDNEKLGKTLEANAATVEALQREKDVLQGEAKSLKERLCRAERTQEQLATKVQNLEHANRTLQEAKQKLEASEIDSKSKLSKLEKMREANEEKIRKLNCALNGSEHANVQLNLEIGALNSQLHEVRNTVSSEHTARVEELTRSLELAREQEQRYEEVNEKLKIEIGELREENYRIGDQLSKVSLSLGISKEHCEKVAREMEQLRADLLIIREEKTQVEREHDATCNRLKDLQSRNERLTSEQHEQVAGLEAKVAALEEELATKIAEVDALHKEVDALGAPTASNTFITQESFSAVSAELDELRSRLSAADEALEKEQKLTAQLRLDNQILQTKYRDSKQRALDATTASEERIKENRLELEGKLEKMKSKMDGPPSLDDSMSALLSTTSGGVRKKCTGITHYKRPGPPTPSKNGGRLSIGGYGSSEPAREILKESCDSNAAASVSSSKTPARFGFFASRFSMGNTKDEAPVLRKCANLRRAVQRKNMQITRNLGAGGVCTSTPRKSKEHFDQRRLLDQLLSSTSPSPLGTEDPQTAGEEYKNISPPDISLIEMPSMPALAKAHPAIAPSRKPSAKRQDIVMAAVRNGRRNSSLFRRRLSRRLRKMVPTTTSGETTSSAPTNAPVEIIRRKTPATTATSSDGGRVTAWHQRLRRRRNREGKARPSLHLHGNIFAKYRTPNRGMLRDFNRNKSRKQRLENFNRYRNLQTGDGGETSEAINCTYNLKNSNYSTRMMGKVKNDLGLEYGLDSCSSDDVGHDGGRIKDVEEELVTSQDLDEFDRNIAEIVTKEDYVYQKGNRNFEELLIATASQAPFEIRHIQFEVSNAHSSHNTTQSQNSSPTEADSKPSTLTLAACSTGPSMATLHNSPSISGHLSRTIYGGSVIFNRRLPNINTTYVRKSSIYIKNNATYSESACDDIILVTNQTITLVDLARMWKQMNSLTRSVVAFAALTSITTLVGLLVAFFSGRNT